MPHTPVCLCRGRKRAALLYVATYSLSCVTKHSSDYWVLMVGRLLGGIATSLLFSAFESWAVAAHNAAGFDEALLSDLFTKAVFLGNGLMAIASGLIGNVLVEDLRLGPVAPFDAAILVLLVGGVAIQLTWAENCGSKQGAIMAEMLGSQFSQALQTIRSGARGGGGSMPFCRCFLDVTGQSEHTWCVGCARGWFSLSKAWADPLQPARLEGAY